MPAMLEHVNVTVSDPARTADLLCRLFGWHRRWQGSAINGGHTIHVGGTDHYVALYTGPGGTAQARADNSYARIGGLNHIAVVVADIAAAERAVRAEGLEPHNHADYEPGRRFYFNDADGVEYEVVSYA